MNQETYNRLFGALKVMEEAKNFNEFYLIDRSDYEHVVRCLREASNTYHFDKLVNDTPLSRHEVFANEIERMMKRFNCSMVEAMMVIKHAKDLE